MTSHDPPASAPPVTVLTAGDDLTADRVAAFRHLVSAHNSISDGPLIVDLLAVTTLDSAGMFELLQLRHGRHRGSNDLHLVVADPAVLNALAAGGIGSIFRVFATTTQALIAIQQPTDPWRT
jgi:anti-anti-sigma factor